MSYLNYSSAFDQREYNGELSAVRHNDRFRNPTHVADRAIDAGAQFLVAPGLNPEVVRHAQLRDVPICPGACTPTEIEQLTLADQANDYLLTTLRTIWGCDCRSMISAPATRR